MSQTWIKQIHYLCFVLILINFVSCKQRKKVAEGEYRMQTYFSKAWDDTAGLPVFKIYPDHHFDMIIKGSVTNSGILKLYDNGFDFQIKNGPVLTAAYITKDSLIRIRNFVALNIEVKFADYILIKPGL
jgi:hypothetical protein